MKIVRDTALGSDVFGLIEALDSPLGESEAHPILVAQKVWLLVCMWHFVVVVAVGATSVARSTSLCDCCPDSLHSLYGGTDDPRGYDYESRQVFACFNESAVMHIEALLAQVQSGRGSASAGASMGVVTYTTDSIMDYAGYSLSMTTVWATQHNYVLRHLSPGTGGEHDSNDQRWNKVKLVEESFGVDGWARDLEYVAYMDSDLVVLDLAFALEDVVAEHPTADLLFSRDSQPLNGLMNSGFFIARNSAWTMTFLREWWGSKETREMAIDQHAFSSLYFKGLPDIESHIALLQPHALNTHFPAWLHQEPSHQVLHLAGCSSMLRVEAFRTGLRNTCLAVQCGDAADAGVVLSATGEVDVASAASAADAEPEPELEPVPVLQLGLTREFLAQLERDQPLTKRAGALLARMRKAVAGAGGPAAVAEEEVADFRNEVRNLFQRGEGATGASSDAHDRCPELKEGLQLIHSVLQGRLDALPPASSSSSSTHHAPEAARERITVLEALCSSGFELAVRLEGWDELAVLLDMEAHVSELVVLTKTWLPDKYRKVLYYMFKHGEFLAAVYEGLGHQSALQAALQVGLETWREMHGLGFYGYGRGVEYADPYAEGVALMGRLGVVHCEAAQYAAGLELLQEAVQLQDETWGRSDLGVVPAEIQHTLADVTADLLTCASAAGAQHLAAAARRRAQILAMGGRGATLIVDEVDVGH